MAGAESRMADMGRPDRRQRRGMVSGRCARAGNDCSHSRRLGNRRMVAMLGRQAAPLRAGPRVAPGASLGRSGRSTMPASPYRTLALLLLGALVCGSSPVHAQAAVTAPLPVAAERYPDKDAAAVMPEVIGATDTRGRQELEQ